MLKKVLREGAAWEISTSDLINAVSKKYKKKRLGVKAATAMENIKHADGVLDAEDSTTFRALAARANYLALDRQDPSFATKELCKDFATPSKHSICKLKRLTRVKCPDLVYHFHSKISSPC